MKSKSKKEKRTARRKRVRSIIRGTNERPRISVFRSNRHVSAQLIDDAGGKTLASADDILLGKSKKNKAGLAARAQEVGIQLAKKALEKNISRAVFDRGGYKYHGAIKAAAEGARKGGLKF